MAADSTVTVSPAIKKEKKDKKRKSDAAGVAPVEPEAVAPAEGTASAEAVIMEVDGEKAAKKAKKEKKEKRKSVAGGAEEEEGKVCLIFFLKEISESTCGYCASEMERCCVDGRASRQGRTKG